MNNTIWKINLLLTPLKCWWQYYKKILASIIWIILLSVSKVQSQDENIFIDPIQPYCYELNGIKEIEPVKLCGDYTGKIIIEASCDTVNNILTDPKILFVKLKSDSNPNDSIEIRQDFVLGNIECIDNNRDKILKCISKIRIEKTGYENCNIPVVAIPIKVISYK